MSVRFQVLEVVSLYKHTEEYRGIMTRWRGLLRTYDNMEDRAAGKPPKRRKRSGNTGGDPATTEE